MTKKSTPPPVPDYAAAATAQGAANVDAARATAKLSNPNIYGPLGSQTISYGEKKVDQAGFDKAMAAYNQPDVTDQAGFDKAMAAYNKTSKWLRGNAPNIANFKSAAKGAAPDIDKFTTTINADIPTIRQTLTPDAQATLNAQQGVEKSLAELGQQGVGQAKTILGTPFNPNLPGIDTSIAESVSPVNQAAFNAGSAQRSVAGPNLQQGIDTSGIAAMPVNAGMTGQQAIMSRLQPQLTQNENATRQRLANQGLVTGGEAYNNEMRTMGQNRNDLELQAAAQGINLDAMMNQQGFEQAAARGQFGNEAQLNQFQSALQNAGMGNTALQQDYQNQLAGQTAQNAAIAQNYNQQLGLAQFGNEAQQQSLDQQLTLRNQPLNQITGLMSGSQIQMPQFQGYQGANIAAAPIYQGVQDTFQGQMDQYAIRQQAKNNMMGGLMSLGGSAAGAGMMAF